MDRTTDIALSQIPIRHVRALAMLICIFGAFGCSSKTSTTDEKAIDTAGETLRVSRLEALVSEAKPNALSRTQEGGWLFASGEQWAYAATVPFDGFGDPLVKGSTEVKLHVTSGSVAVGLLTDHNEILQEKIVDPTTAGESLTFNLGSANFESLVFRSAAPRGTVSKALLESVDYVFQVRRLPNVVSLQQINKIDPAASLETGPPVKIVAGAKWGFAATIPLAVPSGNNLAFVRVKATVKNGRVGVGVLDTSGKVAKNERFYGPSRGAMDYFELLPDNASSVLFRSDSDEKSEMVIEEVSVFRLM